MKQDFLRLYLFQVIPGIPFPVFIGIALPAGCSVLLPWEQETRPRIAKKEKKVIIDRIAQLLLKSKNFMALFPFRKPAASENLNPNLEVSPCLTH